MYLKERQGGPLLPVPSLESHGSMIIGITSAITAVSITMIIARMYVRAFMIKKVGVDDYIILVGGILSIMVLVCIIEEVKLGVGEHLGNPHQTANIGGILHWSYFHGWLIVCGISSAKLSVGFFLMRLVQGKWYKRFVISWIVFTFLFMLACVGTLLFQCLPVNASWNFALRFNPKTKCYSTTTFTNIGLFNGAVNIITDFMFATLPIPIVLQLQINLRTKITLVCILSLGYFACAVAILKEILLSRYFGEADALFNDAYQIWNDIEMNVGIIAACLPALRPLFATFYDAVSTLRSSTRRTGAYGGAQGRYYAQEDYKLGSMPSRSTHEKHCYGVSVVAAGSGEDFKCQASASSRGVPTSRLEASIQTSLAENSSEENILQPPKRMSSMAFTPVQRERKNNGGIMRTTTTEVTVSR